jgi:hypothetical protein
LRSSIITDEIGRWRGRRLGDRPVSDLKSERYAMKVDGKASPLNLKIENDVIQRA